MTSKKPDAQLQLNFNEVETEPAPNIQRDDSGLAGIEKSALGDDPVKNSLMEAIVDELNMEIAWARVKANRGAPGPDGVTVEDFPEWIAPRWKQIRRQLLEGTYRPSPARRVTIDKPGGGTRDLGIPNLVERVIQQATKTCGMTACGVRPPLFSSSVRLRFAAFLLWRPIRAGCG
jgi:RNA-directed DNA polymerase